MAFIWSFTSNIDKIGVQNSSPVFGSISLTCFLAVSLVPPMVIFSKQTPKQVMGHAKYLVPLGVFNALTLLAQMVAINFVLVAYVISIKRGSVVWGYLFFNEKGLRERLIGVVIMVAGVFLITLS